MDANSKQGHENQGMELAQEQFGPVSRACVYHCTLGARVHLTNTRRTTVVPSLIMTGPYSSIL